MKALLLVLVIFIAAYLAGNWLKPSENKATNVVKYDCDPSLRVCETSDGGFKSRIWFEGEPSPLLPFNVVFESDRPAIESVQISFEMQGMDMGYNVHSLKQENGKWFVSVILPVCSLSRNDWQLLVQISVAGKTVASEFGFVQSQ